MSEHKITKEQIQEIIQDYNKGLSCNEIAEKIGFSNTTVLSYLKRNNIEMRSAKFYNKLITLNQEDEVIDIYLNQNLSCVQIAKMFNVKARSIITILKEHNIEVRDATFYNNSLSSADEKEIINLYKQGISINEIKAKFGTNNRKISYILKTKTNGEVSESELFTRLTPEKENEIIKLYHKGLSCAEISNMVKVSKLMVWRYLSKRNLKLNIRKFASIINPSDETKIINLYTNGITSTKIAQMYNTSPGSILSLLKKNNIEIKKSKYYITKVDQNIKNEILKLHKEGLSSLIISKRVNFSSNTIYKIIRENSKPNIPPIF
jgi:transposase